MEDIYKTIAADLKEPSEQYDAALYVGRFCPMHRGHQAMIGGIVEAFPKNHLVLIGSCNQEISFRNLFRYADRCDFIETVFPEISIASLPDFPGDDASWFRALDQHLKNAGYDPKKTVFIGGCHEDVAWYHDMNRNVHIVNRFGGLTQNVSGTEVRDALIEKRTGNLEQLLDEQIVSIVEERFDERWRELRQK